MKTNNLSLLLAEQERAVCLERALHRLSPREREVISLHYGFEGETNLSLKEVSRHLHISYPRTVVLRKLALSKLKLSLQIQHYDSLEL